MHPTTQTTHKPLSSFIFFSMLYSSSVSSTMIGEYIGMESCVDLNVNNVINEGDEHRHDEGGYYNQRRKRDNDQRSMMKKKEFPPLITSLARTENQPSHMPWVLKRYYTNDGRLILREEKVRHHEYFKAHRADGRLTLQLVALDEDDDAADSICSSTGDNENEDQKEHCINADQEENTDDYIDENDDFATNRFDLGKLVSYNENENQYEQCHGNNEDQEEADAVKLASPVTESSPVGGGGNGKCLIYSNVSKISFEVPAIRPVH